MPCPVIPRLSSLLLEARIKRSECHAQAEKNPTAENVARLAKWQSRLNDYYEQTNDHLEHCKICKEHF